MKKNKGLILGCLIAIAIYWLLVVVIYVGEGRQLFYRDAKTSDLKLDGNTVSEEITKDFNIRYVFSPGIDNIEEIVMKFATWNHKDASIHVVIKNDGRNEILLDNEYQVSEIPDSNSFSLAISEQLSYSARFERISIEISSDDASNGNSAAPWINTEFKPEGSQLYYNGQEVNGSLSMECRGTNNVWLGSIYWRVAGLFFLVLCLYMTYIIVRIRANRQTLVIIAFNAMRRYWFLIKQLVSRDFKTKYKKSVLGVLWSLINPLLAMSIQYIVFSTIFKNNIENYPLYLLSGYAIFNFFSEAVNFATESVVGNVALITKVYVPKYIYPFTRVCSSAINLFISILLLLIMCIIMRVPFGTSLLLIPFPLIFIFVFALGIGLLLSTMMVFFRDVKFLWGAISLVWMYATPIFYPTSIIPDKYRIILELNPIACILQVFRTVLIYGQGVEPKLFALCIVYAFGAFVIGSWAFKKYQDDFILYL